MLTPFKEAVLYNSFLRALSSLLFYTFNDQSIWTLECLMRLQAVINAAKSLYAYLEAYRLAERLVG
jgi:hypothetical protein